VKLAYIHADDLIEVNKSGRRMYGRVVEIRDGVVQFEPLCRADEPDGDQPVAIPREQLSLPMAR
jgi:hypothetical protein